MMAGKNYSLSVLGLLPGRFLVLAALVDSRDWMATSEIMRQTGMTIGSTIAALDTLGTEKLCRSVQMDYEIGSSAARLGPKKRPRHWCVTKQGLTHYHSAQRIISGFLGRRSVL